MEAELLKLGIAGLFVLYLIMSGREKDKRYDKLSDKFYTLQETRAIELSKDTEARIEAAAAMKQLASSIEVVVETTAAATRALEVERRLNRRQRQKRR